MPAGAAGFSVHTFLDASPALSLLGAPPPWFSGISFQVNDLHSNPCLGSGSGDPKLKRMVTREYLRMDEGSGEGLFSRPALGVGGSLAVPLPSLAQRSKCSIRQKGALGRKALPQSEGINQDWSLCCGLQRGKEGRFTEPPNHPGSIHLQKSFTFAYWGGWRVGGRYWPHLQHAEVLGPGNEPTPPLQPEPQR